MLFDKHLFPISFKQWIFWDRENRIIIFFSLLLTIILYRTFLYFYPFPNFLPDSYSYIDAAYNNLNINIWPVGYSKFLRLVSVFNYTDRGLFFVQYFILQFSILFFVLTIGFLLKLEKWIIRILLGVLLLNPLSLYVCNFVSSDSLFAAVSLLWLTTLIWLLYDPGKDLLLLHGFILFVVFSIRYNSLYYPLITLLVLCIKRGIIKYFILKLILTLGPVLCFVFYTTWLFNLKTKTLQFSPFGGWQLGANALYMYSHILKDERPVASSKFKVLHGITNKYIDSIQQLKPEKRPDNQLGFHYLWGEGAPLKEYLKRRYKNDSVTNYLQRWVSVAPLYGQYGIWLIKKYPKEYLTYFLYPNLINYYTPPQEFLGIYNMGSDTVEVGAIRWFKYNTEKVKVNLPKKNKNILITSIYPIFFSLINIIFFFGFCGFIFLNGLRSVSMHYKRVIFLMVFIWGSNMIFSVIASPIVLRYQIFPFIYTLVFSTIWMSYIVQKSFFLKMDDKDPLLSNTISVV